jgi:hypothetical protein
VELAKVGSGNAGTYLDIFLTLQHLFALEQREELVKAIQESAGAYVGIAIKQRKEPIKLDQFIEHRMGKYR